MSTIDEIYQTLGLTPALEFEQAKIAEICGRLKVDQCPERLLRGTGATTRMLTMALVDLMRNVKIDLHMPTQTECNHAQRWLWEKYCQVTGKSISLASLQPYLFVRVHSDNYQDDAQVYQDHVRDPLENIDVRSLGPFAWARYMRTNAKNIRAAWLPDTPASSDTVDLLDIDQNLICTVTIAGFRALQDRHFTNIEVI